MKIIAIEGIFSYSLHPAIRVVTLLVFCSWVALGNSLSHVVAAVMALALGLVLGRRFWLPFTRALRRLRWFFLSIVVLYLWFVPVEDVDHVGVVTWYAEGAIAGLERVLVLAVILVAVTAFITTTPRSELLNAVMWLSRPAGWFGLCPETVAVRFTLLFDVLAQIEQVVEGARREAKFAPSLGPRLEGWGRSATTLFTETIARAMSAPLEPLDLPPVRSPVWLEWSVPVLLALIGFACSFG